MAAHRRIPYEEVAELVTGWPRLTGFVPAIAENYGIPRTTAARWVAQARLRGFLPRATKQAPCPRCAGTGKVDATFGPKDRELLPRISPDSVR